MVDKLRTLSFGMVGREYRVYGLGDHWRIMVNNVLDSDKFSRFRDAYRIAKDSYDIDRLEDRVFRDAEEDTSGKIWHGRGSRRGSGISLF